MALFAIAGCTQVTSALTTICANDAGVLAVLADIKPLLSPVEIVAVDGAVATLDTACSAINPTTTSVSDAVLKAEQTLTDIVAAHVKTSAKASTPISWDDAKTRWQSHK